MHRVCNATWRSDSGNGASFGSTSETKTSEPMGGYVLWVELPADVDSMRLYQLALENGITVGPGYMFSTTPSYRNFIRLNYSYPWNERVESAVITLGKLVASCMRTAA